MPTYDYRCKACRHAFEHFQSMKDAVLRKCPACGKASLERLIGTGAALIFKGAGFYQTDYRSESYKAAEHAEKPAEKGSEQSTERGTTQASQATGSNAGGAAATSTNAAAPVQTGGSNGASAKNSSGNTSEGGGGSATTTRGNASEREGSAPSRASTRIATATTSTRKTPAKGPDTVKAKSKATAPRKASTRKK